MSDSLLLTKLYVPPPRSNLVLRPRLVEQLNKGFSFGRKLTLISAPAGFGKTTLVSEWLDGCQRQVAWLSLDEGDKDPMRFISYFIAAVQTIKEGFGDSVLGILQSPEPLDIEPILTMLLNEISTFAEPFLLVLEDYHAVDSKQVDHCLEFLVEYQPPQMHLVITSREDPQLPLARYRARGQLAEFRAADLRFTTDEAAELLNHLTGLALSYQNIAALETRTEGWVAGLQLAAISLQGLKDPDGFIQSFTGSHRFVMDYLIEEVLNQQSEGNQKFLLCTSILDRMCGQLCDAILPDHSVTGQSIIEYLERSNLFIVPLDNERHWFRYHHLFGDLLRNRLEQRLSQEDIALLHTRASDWYETKGMILEAFNHATLTRDIQRAERLMEHKGMPIDMPGVPLTILNWLETLPVSVLNDNPSLWWKQAAMMLSSYQTIGVEEKLRAAEAALASKIPPNSEMDERTRDLVGKIAVARAMLAQTVYQAETCLENADRALKYLDPNNTAYRSTTTQIIGFAHYIQGDRDAAEQAFTEALFLARAAGDYTGAIIATLRLGMIHELRNQLHQAAEKYQHSLQLLGEDPPPLATSAYVGLARIHLEWNELDSAEKYAEQAFQQAKLCEQVIDRLIASEMVLSRLKLARGDTEGATYWLSQAEKNARKADLTVRLPDIACCQALIHLYRDDAGAATQIANQYEHLQYDLVHNDILIIRAQALIAQGDSAAALELLEPYRLQMEEKKWEDQLLRAIVLQALAFHLQGEKDRAYQALTEALTVSEPGTFIRSYLDYGEPMRSLIVDFRTWIGKQSVDRAHPLTNYVNKLLAAFAPSEVVLETKTTNPQSGLFEPISQRELEVLKLLRSDLNGPEIAQQLSVSINTFRTHTKNIFIKLGVNDRRAAVRRAVELDLI